ncbi:MAG: hypothetical protein WDN46_21085 [Methylocella sp.]
MIFITLKYKGGIANLLVWTKVFEQCRRVVLSGGMIAVRGCIQRLALTRIAILATPPFARCDAIDVAGSQEFE